MEYFAGQSQINTLGEAVSTLLVSSYFSVDQSYPITVEVMGGVTKTIVVSKRLYGIPSFSCLPIYFFIPLLHKACFAKHF